MRFFRLYSKKLVRNLAVLMALLLSLNGFSDKVVYAHAADPVPSILTILQMQSELFYSGQAKSTPLPVQTAEWVSAGSADIIAYDNIDDITTETQVEATPIPTPTPIPNKIFYSVKSEKKQVALTFDDGPDAYFTPMILDILKENNIKATFFVLGCNAEKNPEVIRRMAEEGHVIGNHSYDHKDLKKLGEEDLQEEILKTEKVLDDLIGKHDPVFRPPYGSTSPQTVEQIAGMGYYVVNWSVDTRDWAGTSQQTMMSYVHKQLYSGGIILMHCSGKRSSIENTVRMLPALIDDLRNQGYEFATVTDMVSGRAGL